MGSAQRKVHSQAWARLCVAQHIQLRELHVVSDFSYLYLQGHPMPIRTDNIQHLFLFSFPFPLQHGPHLALCATSHYNQFWSVQGFWHYGH